MHYSELLLPELETELESVRQTLDRVPDGKSDFRPHVKSFTLSQLAGHLAEMPMFVQATLTNPDVDFAKNGYVPLVMESKQQVMTAYTEMADELIAFVKNTSDKTVEQSCQLLWDGQVIFSGTRYNAYRTLG